MVIIGVMKSEEEIAKMPGVEYYKGLDAKEVCFKELDVKIVPWALLIDPKGVVRWEGNPNDLTDEIIQEIFKKHKNRI